MIACKVGVVIFFCKCEWFTSIVFLKKMLLVLFQGQYLSPIGSRAVLKSRSNTVTKDELFALEDSLPQASFGAVLNTRYVSVKQGESRCSGDAVGAGSSAPTGQWHWIATGRPRGIWWLWWAWLGLSAGGKCGVGVKGIVSGEECLFVSIVNDSVF